MLTLEELPRQLPAAHGRYTLLKHLGGGWTSDVYLAELAGDSEPIMSGLPKQFALKLAVDKTAHYYEMLTVEKIEAMMLKEHANAILLDHPCVVRIYSDAVPENRKHIEIISEAACCNVRQLQGAMTDSPEDWNNNLPMPVIKYIAAQLLLGMQYLHAKRIFWGDPMSQNIVIMPDFTVRIIDIVSEWAPEIEQENDVRMLAAVMYCMQAGDDETAHKPREWLLRRFEKRCAEAPLFYEMLTELVSAKSLDGVWAAKFWSSNEGGTSSLIMLDLESDGKLEEMMKLKEPAWNSLPVCAQTFSQDRGIKGPIE